MAGLRLAPLPRPPVENSLPQCRETDAFHVGAKRQFVDRIVNADPPNICRIELADVGSSVGRCHQVAPSRLDFPDCLNRDVVGSPERVREAVNGRSELFPQRFEAPTDLLRGFRRVTPPEVDMAPSMGTDVEAALAQRP